MKKLIPAYTVVVALTACGGSSGGDNASADVASDDSANNDITTTALVVDAGKSITTDERSNVLLKAAVGSDDKVTSVTWLQVSGSMVELDDANSLTPQFKAPETNDDEFIVFRVTATDNQNRRVSDDVIINIRDRTRSPQGIDGNTRDRRSEARSRRNNNRPVVGSREVRTYDGTNNNTTNTLWGASFTQLERWGGVDYGDGISSVAGASRPSARVVSNNLAAQDAGVSIPNSYRSSDFLWQWGQFIDHDIGITDGAEESFDISVPTGDVYFDPNGTGEEVILFSRAFFDHNTGTSTSNPRQQENEITAWIDGSMVYGSDDARAEALRASAGSQYLATSSGNLLPFNTSGQTNANAFGVDDADLFVAGDVRANEQVGLAAMHTLWVREHNRLADIVSSNSPRLSGDEVFEATRRLVIAKIQMITFNEFLPELIGERAISDYEGYDASVNPGLFNEFSVAAYRFGHSLVNETLLRLDSEGNTIDEGSLPLSAAFFTAPSILTDETSIDPIFRGMANQLSQTLDTKGNNSLRNLLFGQPGSGGLDLLSLNIQRGRDHGVPSYNAMREVFGLGKKNSFAEVSSDADVQVALAATYDNVDDIDLWVGGLAEDALTRQGSQLGELFREMHIAQFEAFRDGDRFWYENDLTDREEAMIQGTTLAQVIRANTSIGNELQDNVFSVPRARRRN